MDARFLIRQSGISYTRNNDDIYSYRNSFQLYRLEYGKCDSKSKPCSNTNSNPGDDM